MAGCLASGVLVGKENNVLTDPIADMITRIRNAHMRKKKEVAVPHSKLKVSILEALAREGYIRGFTEGVGENQHPVLNVELKYYNGKPVIQSIQRVSRPSVQHYTSVRKMSPIANGLGNAILSTSRGVLSDREAKGHHVGGKILLTVR